MNQFNWHQNQILNCPLFSFVSTGAYRKCFLQIPIFSILFDCVPAHAVHVTCQRHFIPLESICFSTAHQNRLVGIQINCLRRSNRTWLRSKRIYASVKRSEKWIEFSQLIRCLLGKWLRFFQFDCFLKRIGWMALHNLCLVLRTFSSYSTSLIHTNIQYFIIWIDCTFTSRMINK